MSVYTKLNQARIQLQRTALKKSGNNKFAGYSYFELGDFLPTIQQIFNDMNLSGIISYGTELASLTITDADDNSQVVITSPMSSASMKGVQEVQNLGAVQTYLRRYLWVTALEIVEHDAIEATTGTEKAPVDSDLLNKWKEIAAQGIDALKVAREKATNADKQILVKHGNELLAIANGTPF